MSGIQSLTTKQLQRALEIRTRIERLQGELDSIAGEQENSTPKTKPKKMRRKMSAAGRARIAAAAKARWRKAKAAGKATLAK
jgi:hypothetical protein